MDKLHFLTAGIPLSAKPKKNMENGLLRIKELGLDGMEVEYVRGVITDYRKMGQVGKLARELGLVLTAHAPYYINFFAREKEKIDKSYQYVLDTARLLDVAGGYSVVFHSAYYLGIKPEDVYPAVKNHLKHLSDLAEKEALKVWLRPELMGKISQFGTLEEIVKLAEEIGGHIYPCIDIAHLHARTGRNNTYEEFAAVFDMLEKRLGEKALKNMHLHYSGIKYSFKGEQKHVILRDSDMRYREFLKALKDFDICGVLVCESPNVEGDALFLKKIYQSM
jgi:deoxyribonuclease IV